VLKFERRDKKEAAPFVKVPPQP